MGYQVKIKGGGEGCGEHGCSPAVTWGISSSRTNACLEAGEKAWKYLTENNNGHFAQKELQELELFIAGLQGNQDFLNKQKDTIMAKEKPAAPPAEEFKVENIKLSDIVASKTNPRKVFDPESINDLAESMKPPIGLMQPITLRSIVNGKYEIVAGERRWRAAKILKWETIPSHIRVISDDELLEFQILENLQREDVSPLDEAKAFKTLLQKETIDWLASKIHKTKKYISDRLKLNDLADEVAARVSSGELPLGHAILISKLPYADQMSCLDECFNGAHFAPGDDDKEICEKTYEDLREFIENKLMLDFSRVHFSLDDVTLYPAAGSCANCPKRTCNANLLFSDITEDDMCTDSSCFNEKKKLHIEREKANAKEKYGQVLSGEKSFMIGTDKVKVQGIAVPIQKAPTKNSIPIMVTKDNTGSHNDGKIVYIDKGNLEKLKVDKKQEPKNSAPKETWQQRELREFKERWDRILFIASVDAPQLFIVNEFFRLKLNDAEDKIVIAFASVAGLLEKELTPEECCNYSFKDNKHRKQLYDLIINKYNPSHLITIISLMESFDDDAAAELDLIKNIGFAWKQMTEMIDPSTKTKKPAPKKK